MKKRTKFLFSLIPLLIGFLLMHYLRRVFMVGLFILFILIVFQTPSQKYDQTGEVNESNIQVLKMIGLSALMFLAGGYLSLILFSFI